MKGYCVLVDWKAPFQACHNFCLRNCPFPFFVEFFDKQKFNDQIYKLFGDYAFYILSKKFFTTFAIKK